MVNIPVPIQTYYFSPKPQVYVYYPIVYGLTNPQVQQRINQAIMSVLHPMLRERGWGSPELVDLNGWFEIKTNEKEVLSLSLLVYSFTGGAHGLTVNKSLTFNVTTGKMYSLGELFKPDSNYVQRLSAIIQRQITERKIQLLGPFRGIKPDQDYYIADRSLVIYFQLYEITPYYYGFQYFPISIYEIQDIINEDGPLGKVLGS
jgi:hypothetical protein